MSMHELPPWPLGALKQLVNPEWGVSRLLLTRVIGWINVSYPEWPLRLNLNDGDRLSQGGLGSSDAYDHDLETDRCHGDGRIVLIPLPGHAPGTTGVLIELDRSGRFTF